MTHSLQQIRADASPIADRFCNARAMDSVDAAPVLLIDLQSVDRSLEVRVLGRFGPGVPGPHDDLEVEFTAKRDPVCHVGAGHPGAR